MGCCGAEASLASRGPRYGWSGIGRISRRVLSASWGMICSPCHRSSMGEPAMLAVINYDQFGHPGWIVAKLEDDRLMAGVTSSSSLSDITKLDIQLLLCI